MKKSVALVVVFLAFLESVRADNFIMDNFSFFLILVFGIFSFLAYIVVTILIYKSQKSFGPWIVFSVISMLILISQFMINNLVWHRRIIALVMFLFFLAALFKYWDILELFDY